MPDGIVQRCVQGLVRGLVRGFVPCVAATALVLGAAPSPTQAAALRIGSAFDPQTMDPHALALLYHSRVAFQVYESLVTRNEKFEIDCFRLGCRAHALFIDELRQMKNRH